MSTTRPAWSVKPGAGRAAEIRRSMHAIAVHGWDGLLLSAGAQSGGELDAGMTIVAMLVD